MSKSDSPLVRTKAFKSLSMYASVNLESLGAITSIAYGRLLNDTDEEARRECERLINIVLKYEVTQVVPVFALANLM
jgi:hypothetical protein